MSKGERGSWKAVTLGWESLKGKILLRMGIIGKRGDVHAFTGSI